MRNVQPNNFWDGQAGGGVRCSSTGEAATQYIDPNAQVLEGNGGRSIASMLPTGLGIRGTIIPRANSLGESRGFDSNKPTLVNIDPDIKGQACVVDISKITKESMAAAYQAAKENEFADADPALLAAQTYHNLAVGFEPVGMFSPNSNVKSVERRSPLGNFGAYVVPKASRGGGQEAEQQYTYKPQEEIMSPSVAPRKAKSVKLDIPIEKGLKYDDEVKAQLADQEYEKEATILLQSQFSDQSTKALKPSTQPVKLAQGSNIVPPSTNVTFEVEGWGTFDAAYHKVIKNDCLLVLVYDTRFKSGMRFTPPSAEGLMAVKIDGQDKTYFVNSTGTKFSHENWEYCILIIDQEN